MQPTALSRQARNDPARAHFELVEKNLYKHFKNATSFLSAIYKIHVAKQAHYDLSKPNDSH